MNLIHVFNKTSPRAHMELELDVLDVPKKLVKYVVHLSKRENCKKKKIPHTSWTNYNQQVLGLKEF
jgi:ribosomal protein L32